MTPARATSSEHAFAAPLSAAGLNLVMPVSLPDYDAIAPAAWRAASLLPAARTALVVASGGRALFDAFRVSAQSADGAPDPLDRFVDAAVAAAAAALRAEGHAAIAVRYDAQRGGDRLDFVALARAAGLGWPSRLGLLIHPDFGPWMSLRSVVLTSLALEAAAPLAGPGPCAGCSLCADACRGRAISAEGAPSAERTPGPPVFDARRCAATREHEVGCRLRCDARRACPVGAAHAYAADAEAHHMRASLHGLSGSIADRG